jgi:uncharacterized membrane protein YheB (UPF0754 family)
LWEEWWKREGRQAELEKLLEELWVEEWKREEEKQVEGLQLEEAKNEVEEYWREVEMKLQLEEWHFHQ